MLDVEMAGFAFVLHPGVLFVGPREEHLYDGIVFLLRVIPKILGNT